VALRIVGGVHRGRLLRAPDDRASDRRALRPTADRVRQTVFDILVHGGLGPDGGDAVGGAAVLDAFAGTGALALEALSRGASSAILFDIAAPSLALARANAAALGETGRVYIRRADATRPPRVGDAPATLAFLDPPYGQGLAAAALAALARARWLAPGCLCVVETAADEPALPAFETLTERAMGGTRIVFGRPTGEDRG
jgi:16S rRNA (guanine966-N2)-methyltransferase